MRVFVLVSSWTYHPSSVGNRSNVIATVTLTRVDSTDGSEVSCTAIDSGTGARATAATAVAASGSDEDDCVPTEIGDTDGVACTRVSAIDVEKYCFDDDPKRPPFLVRIKVSSTSDPR